MTETSERVCIVCGADGEVVRLELCFICGRGYCIDCAFRTTFGRRFCSSECGRAYYFTGELDDDENPEQDE